VKDPIAIIGIGCRFPGAHDPDAFWQLLRSGQSAIREIPADRWDIDGLYDPNPVQPGKVTSRWGGFLDQIDQFDWRAFKILPREATYMDPQQRLLLEVAWEALEDAGLLFSEVAGSQTGVFVGAGWNDYLRLQSQNWSDINGYTATGNATCFAANRLSYFFDLRGPSTALDAGCTSSLNAMHLACQSLWAEEIDLALVGGVSLQISPDNMLMLSKAGLFSPDGCCKTLDASADGFVVGEGAGIIVLKRLSQVRPEDRIYALLLGIASGHNGHNEWIMAPNRPAQEALLLESYRKASVDPGEIDYVELHGTGFRQGDAIETQALGAALATSADRKRPCMIGSVKTNIGHLGVASGIASLIKTALALYHREIPPTLNLQTLNPDIDLQALQLAVPREVVPWPEKDTPALAGVSGFSLSGANAHAVLAAAPRCATHDHAHNNGRENQLLLLPLSAQTAKGLHTYTAAFKNFLRGEESSRVSGQDICYTASVRRTHWPHRLAVIGYTLDELADALDSFLQGHKVRRFFTSEEEAPTYTPSLELDRTSQETFFEALAHLYTQGETINWPGLYENKDCHCVSLPTFPWQRERLWIEWLDTNAISTPPESKTIRLQANEKAGALEEIDWSSLPLEEALVKLWAHVLGLKHVRPDDSFFELGGHSLLASQLIAQMRDKLQIEISLNTLFNASTPSACAAFILQNRVALEDTSSSVLPLVTSDPAHRFAPFATTDVQQAYWVGRNMASALLNVGNHGYIEVAAFSLDIQRFNRAMQRLIERHEMLCAIILPDGQQQILSIVPPFEATIVDMRGKDQAEVADSLQNLRQEMDHQLLPVEQWPAFDIRIVLLDEQRSQIHVSVESLFVDAWSMHLLIQEFIQFYHDPDVQLPALELSFRDYLQTEMTRHDTAIYRRAENYWMKRLSDLPPAPDLPLLPQSSSPQPRFVHREARLDAETWSRLKARAARAGLTPSGVLLAAFAEVLHTWSKSPRFSLNLSIFNRLPLHPQVNSIVGDFTSLIVLAIEHSADTFEQRARCIQEQLWSDLDHSIYSGVRVLRELGRRQGNMATGVMPIVFTSLLIEDMANQLPPPWQETLYCVSQTPQVWLDHQVLESGGTLIMHWQVVEALFQAGVIDAMFSAYCQLLQRLATEEETWQTPSISLVPAEQLALYAQMNATDVQQEPCLLQELFIRQVSRDPKQPAIITSQRVLSYAEVYAGSLILAYQLRRLGARPNQLVGIVMEKGWEQVVAALGILQSGAAYLPIDPTWPEERLHYLLEHSNVKIVLTQTFLAQRINWPDTLKFLYVDTLELQNTHLIELEAVQTPQDLAYVIYTSGSTGQPKGVMIDHRGAVNTILDINERFQVGPQDRVLALSAFTFDLSVYDIFGLLAAGGTIVLPDKDAARDPLVWLEFLVEERVTIWNTVPALLQLLVEAAQEQGTFPGNSLRLALLSGDWIPLTLPGQLKALIPGVEVISLGGATEASIWSIFYPIGDIEPSWKSIPYGRPLRNQHFYVLNESLEPCPLWVPGHLYIGGVGLAQGYWGDEEKTQASFLLHPRTRERLYKTGDLGRYLPDGTIEFLGREDFQVKIQGYRIELGEIESVLSRHPKIQEAIVTAVGETRGEKRLVAYIVCLPDCSLQLSELRTFLEERLPGYMVPSNFIFLERLPLTSNGKVDRKALPTPAQNEMQQQGAALEETALVAQIRDILTRVLKVEHIEPHQNLLDYGVTSIDILRIANQLQSQLHIRLYVGQLYRYATLAALAQYCEQALSAAGEPSDRQSSIPNAAPTTTTYEEANEWEEGVL
jgi:amino acid adenylation domain-containing protein